MRVLYQFPLSHYCEKARWLLDHKELDYVAHNLIPGFHRAFAQLKTGQNLLPILKDDHRWIAESTKIALYLDDTYPNMHFYAVMNNLDSKLLKLIVWQMNLGCMYVVGHLLIL